MKRMSGNSMFVISYYTGYVVLGTAILMLIPLITAVIMQEWNPGLDFLISISISTIAGILMIGVGKGSREQENALKWKHGFVIAALSWIVLMVLCSIPYLLSGHYLSLLDACFDVMSGFTTTGLALIQDMDHISVSLNMWRHVLTFVGGQGMVVLALTFLIKNTGGAYKVYVGEAKDVELVPNVMGTARQIWKISIIYLAIGTIALWITGITIGFQPVSALFHAIFMFASSWSTGGFAPYSQNIMYYHSFIYEIITLVFFILGSLNFGLHYAVWQKNKKELIRNIEVQSFTITVFIACVLAVILMAKTGLYTEAVTAFRRVVYNVLSAHTTTGLGTIYTRQFANEWGDKGVLILIIAMLIGGSACSTAGGIKGLRVGIIVKGLISDVKKILSSERSVKIYKIHHIKDIVLEDPTVKSASLITICYFITFAGGTLLATFYGYPLLESSFEAASVTGNVGLSIGVTTASMPALLKIYYIIAMYLGRLEFLSVFALFGYIIGGIKKRCLRKA
jgi:trk system potassium uptake protein TrkH